MRTVMIAIVVVVGVVGYMARTAFVPESSGSPASANEPIEASATLWPHEIHTDYKAMKELPVHDVKDEAF
jgi:hypothetical protein